MWAKGWTLLSHASSAQGMRWRRIHRAHQESSVIQGRTVRVGESQRHSCFVLGLGVGMADTSVQLLRVALEAPCSFSLRHASGHSVKVMLSWEGR